MINMMNFTIAGSNPNSKISPANQSGASQVLKVNFYGETFTMIMPESLDKLKAEISKAYEMEEEDVQELVMHYLDEEGEKISLSSENDYQHMMTKSQPSKEISLEVSESSRLYIREIEMSRISKFKSQINPINSSTAQINLNSSRNFHNSLKYNMEKSSFEDSKIKLKEEIMEKERLLKDLLEKEREEIERREQRMRDEEKREQERLAQIHLQKQRERKEKEEMEKEQLRQSITKTVTEILNANIEQIREQLIEKTVRETSETIEKCFEEEKQENKAIHYGVSCDGCHKYPVTGSRYKCLSCYDFDYCEDCEKIYGEEHGHAFIKYRHSEDDYITTDMTNSINLQSLLPKKSFLDFFKEKLKNLFCGKAKEKHRKQRGSKTIKDIRESFCEETSESKTNDSKTTDGKMYASTCNNDYSKQLEDMKKNYLVKDLCDEKILEVLAKCEGNIDEAVTLLF